jgi:translocation and assembly module TamB
VFTPSLGLIPYVDVALRTRVSDTINVGQSQSGSVSSWDLRTSDTPLDQLRLVRVTLQASGPADRLVDQIRLRSSPPLPEDRLVALIGGNSLAGLSNGNAGTALATVLGQTLLTPLVGSLSEAFGQRFSFALYPTYVVPAVSDASEGRSGRVPSELVLGSEIGVDLSDRINLSVLAAPNRTDIPPQMTLRYQASDRLGVQGSVDGQGRWQTQLQLYLRF